VDVRCGAGGVLARGPVALPDGLGACLGQALGQERSERREFVVRGLQVRSGFRRWTGDLLWKYSSGGNKSKVRELRE
jgi:hypothetical protein